MTEREQPTPAPTRAPVLVGLALLAGLIDLAVHRIGLQVLPAGPLTFLVLRHAVFVQALAAIAGFAVAVELGLSAIASYGLTPMSLLGMVQRLAVSGVLGVVVPSVAMTFWLPARDLAGQWVFFSVLATNTLLAVLGMLAVSSLRTPEGRVASLAALASICALAGLVLMTLRALIDGLTGLDGPGVVLRVLAEIAWLAAPLVAWPRVLPGRHRVVVLSTLLVAVALALLLQSSLGDESARVVYAAFRLAVLPASLTWTYAVPVGTSLGIALALATSGRPGLGAGIGLWIVAGLAPRVPCLVVLQLLAGWLFWHAATFSTAEGKQRMALRWARRMNFADTN